MTTYRQKTGKIYYRYGNELFSTPREAYKIAWRLKQRNRKIKYKITPYDLNGKRYWKLWLTNYIRW